MAEVIQNAKISYLCTKKINIEFVYYKEKKDATDAPKGKDKLSFDDATFQQLEQEFKDVLTELMGDRSLEKFKIEYEKLHKALLKSHESEKRLMQKCRELNAEMVANSAKVQAALKLSTDDANTIGSMKKVWTTPIGWKGK
jgi:hypothetical protein